MVAAGEAADEVPPGRRGDNKADDTNKASPFSFFSRSFSSFRTVEEEVGGGGCDNSSEKDGREGKTSSCDVVVVPTSSSGCEKCHLAAGEAEGPPLVRRRFSGIFFCLVSGFDPIVHGIPIHPEEEGGHPTVPPESGASDAEGHDDRVGPPSAARWARSGSPAEEGEHPGDGTAKDVGGGGGYDTTGMGYEGWPKGGNPSGSGRGGGVFLEPKYE